jgi:hypothetical protein
MKISVNQDNTIQLEEVFNPVILKTADGEEMAICMRDGGFEFKYQGEMYFAKGGYVEPFQKSVRGNYLVEQAHTEESESPRNSSACDHRDSYIVSGAFGGRWCENCKEMVDEKSED